MVESVAKTLGVGSGIDVTALVASLVENQYAVKNQTLDRRAETLTAQLSAVSKLKSGITGFSTALGTLVKGGSLATQPTSANTGVVKVSGLPGARLSGLSATVEVRALATSQVSYAAPLAKDTPIGTGVIQIALAGADPGDPPIPPIAITDADQTLSGIAARINAARTGVTASIVSDVDGERLVLKGATGAAQAFTLSVTEDAAAPGLGRIAVGGGATGATTVSTAGDARVAVDGVEVRRATNSISDLLPGVRLELQTASVGAVVQIGSTPATEGLRQAVNDVVATYNELYAILREETDPIKGALRADPAARDMLSRLRSLTLTDLTGGDDDDGPKTLAELGVATARDGALSVDATRLNDALTRFPNAVEAIFADGVGATKRGLGGALQAIAATVTSAKFGLGASESRYTTLQGEIVEQKADVAEATETTRARLTQQYASMDARVAAYRSTQSFLEQQIAAWNGGLTMARYAMASAAAAYETYRAVDLAGRTGGADPHQLVSLLYAEASRALRSAAWAAENGRFDLKSERVTRALAILFALETGLDFEKGGEVSKTLSRVYQGARQTVIDASLSTAPAPFLEVATMLDEIAEAWAAARGR